MESMTPVNNNPINFGSIETIPQSAVIATGKSATERPVQPAQESFESGERPNFKEYYSQDLIASVVDNVRQSSEQLSQAMSNALANGYTPQDACKIKCAQAAYEANCRIAKSTFSFAV